MQKTGSANDIVSNMAVRIRKDLEFRWWLARALPKMGGGQRSVAMQAVVESGISDDRLSRAMMREPRAEDIIREPKRLTLIQ